MLKGKQFCVGEHPLDSEDLLFVHHMHNVCLRLQKVSWLFLQCRFRVQNHATSLFPEVTVQVYACKYKKIVCFGGKITTWAKYCQA